MHLLFTPNHVHLITACYPPSSALLSSGPQYSPNSQELSRLTYYASNRPGKINKLGSELERRVRLESRKAKAGNTRSKASLLISLSIFRALATECRRDISLLSPSLIASVNATLTALSSDLEVSARAASVFATWATYSDGRLIGVDSNVTQDYISSLRQFASLSCVEGKSSDHEFRNRTRLVGLAALTGAVNSEVLYNTSSEFKTQVTLIMRPLLVTLLFTELSVLDQESSAIKDKLQSPYLNEFRTRPAIERRAASIHIHVDGDSGPATTEVIKACMRTLASLLQHSNSWQLGHIMQATFDGLDELKSWGKLDQCRWLARKACEWTQYQYRYTIPTRLVEYLLESQDATTSSALQSALTAMITTVFTSSIPLINLSTSDIISNLITLVLHRVVINPEDSLLPSLVECIASLGTHVYYSDQISDLAAELISRLVTVETQGIPGQTQDNSKKSRSQAIRSLLAGLLGLMQAADKDESNARARSGSAAISPVSPNKNASPVQDTHSHPSKRTRVSPEIWHDTLSLLCDADYAVRADYADALIFYLRNEIPKRGDSTDADGVKRIHPLSEGPIQQATNMKLLIHGDSATRALNAAHGYLFVLATASSLGFDTSTRASSAYTVPTDDSSANAMADSPPPNEGPEIQESPPQSQRQPRRSMTIPPRKASVVLSAIQSIPPRISSSAAATASDYAHILVMLTAMHEQLPARGLLVGVPMLLALDVATAITDLIDAATLQRLWTIKEVLAKVWLVLGKVWDCVELVSIAEKAIAALPGVSNLPNHDHKASGISNAAPEPVGFNASDSKAVGSWSGVNTETALSVLVSSKRVQDTTGLDRQGLLRRFAQPWSPEYALSESMERPSNYDALRGDGISPLLKISPALMHIDNVSLASLARSTRGVGVTDLREALEGRSSASNPALAKAPSISTLDHTSSPATGAPLRPTTSRSSRKKKPRPVTTGPDEVRDVLNKLGIGKQNGNSLLKASFPALQKAEQQ